MSTKYIKVAVSERLPEKECDIYVIERGGFDFELRTYNNSKVKYFLENFNYWLEEIPDNEESLLKQNAEMKAMLEEMINWYAKREESPMKMNPDMVICEGENQDRIIIEAQYLLNKTT